MSKPQCKYNEMCFRLNPIHFEQYSHKHLDEIFLAGERNGHFKIPEDLEENTDKINQQLEILKNIQKRMKRTEKEDLKLPVAKVPKIDQNDSRQAGTSSPKPFFNKNMKIEQNSPSTSQVKSKLESKAVNDFFKERASIFKTKDPEKMKAPDTPPKSQKPQISDAVLEEKMKQFLPVIAPRGLMENKIRNSAPYNIFLTTVTDSIQTHTDPLSVTFLELLDPSLGELESSVQFNFMVDIAWLMAQYTFGRARHLPLLILYGQDMEGLAEINKKLPNVTTIKVPITTPIGCHHTKMMIFFYKNNSMRLVISTANLYEDDWHNRVQGLWISDQLPALSEGVSHINNGESVTNFRSDLLTYLHAYNIPKLQPTIARIRSTDFSTVNVFFVASVPGTHNGVNFGHPRVGKLLSENSAPIDDTCAIILQASSLGGFGPKPSDYLLGEIGQSFRRDSAPVGIRKQPSVKLIYPSLNNVLNSHDKILGGGCLPYDGKINEKQLWLKDYLYQWKCISRHRNQAMPHIKSYCRYSDRGLYWFILTSANMSRSAWGSFNKSKSLNSSLRINSYEAGVVLFPRIMINKDRFPLNEQQQRDDEKIFKLPFDIPPIPYGHDDIPFTQEYLKEFLLRK